MQKTYYKFVINPTNNTCKKVKINNPPTLNLPATCKKNPNQCICYQLRREFKELLYNTAIN